MSYTLLDEKSKISINYSNGIKSSYLKSKIGAVITDFKSRFIIVGISAVNCALLQVFYDTELAQELIDSERFYKIEIKEGAERYAGHVDCSAIIGKNLEDIVSWLNNYPASVIAHVDLNEFDEIIHILKHSASIPYKIRRAI
jgi:hypothetical protein